MRQPANMSPELVTYMWRGGDGCCYMNLLRVDPQWARTWTDGPLHCVASGTGHLVTVPFGLFLISGFLL